jgi:hemerythrin
MGQNHLTLLDRSDRTCLPVLNEMDTTHDEFIQIINRLSAASNTEFRALFTQLFQHTQRHFNREQELMEHTGFPAIAEHIAEHQRVLGELDRFATKVNNGIFMFARAYVREQLPGWFNLHLATMDGTLAAHLSQCSEVSDEN